MSAFLGKIHYWLYNKILLHESFIDSLFRLAEAKGVGTELMRKECYKKFGQPVTEALESVIDTGNIHGWLQNKIERVESRLAWVLTALIHQKMLHREEVVTVFYRLGNSVAEKDQITRNHPKDVYHSIFNYMLEGMPCDRVNAIVEDTEGIFSWQTLRCLHQQHWTAVGGNVTEFYHLRDAWIRGFLSAGDHRYTYSRTEEGLHAIERMG